MSIFPKTETITIRPSGQHLIFHVLSEKGRSQIFARSPRDFRQKVPSTTVVIFLSTMSQDFQHKIYTNTYNPTKCT